MDLSNLTIGYGITGSFCTFAKSKVAIGELTKKGARVIPVFSEHAAGWDTRFGKATDHVKEICQMTGSKGIFTVVEAEPIGPKELLDVMVIAPCTGNTAAKLVNGIVDTTVLMAAKAHLRGNKPLVLAISSNDALGLNFKNIGMLMSTKNIYLVPFGQDSPLGKPNSLVADLSLLPDTIEEALQGRQLQPVLRGLGK